MTNKLIYSFLFLSFGIYSQNNLRLYSANGELFKVYLNDKLFSNHAQASIVLDNIKKDTLYLKVEFDTKEKFGMSVYLLDQGKPTKNKEFNYKIQLSNGKLNVNFTGTYDALALPDPLLPKAPKEDSTNSLRKPGGR
jgi:hypothetical protein